MIILARNFFLEIRCQTEESGQTARPLDVNGFGMVHRRRDAHAAILIIFTDISGTQQFKIKATGILHRYRHDFSKDTPQILRRSFAAEFHVRIHCRTPDKPFQARQRLHFLSPQESQARDKAKLQHPQAHTRLPSSGKVLQTPPLPQAAPVRRQTMPPLERRKPFSAFHLVLTPQ